MSLRPRRTQVPRRRFVQNMLIAGGGYSLLCSQALGNETGEPVHDELVRALGKAELSQLFRGKTAEDCRQWQRSFRATLIKLLGDSTPPAKWEPVQIRRDEFEKHIRVELELRAEGVPTLPVYLLLAKGLPPGRRMPGVVCVHGHGPAGNDAIVGRIEVEGVAEQVNQLSYDYGRQFAERGYAVAAPCMIPFGRRVDRERYGGNDPCAVTFVRMQALGKLPITANLRDLRWCLDLLQSRPEVQQDALGCAGLSYGGRMTMMLAAIDERVRVAAVSGALNLMQERVMGRHSCGSQMIPGLLQYGDYPEIGSLIAPRPAVWETGSQDRLIVSPWDETFRDRLRRAYGALGAEDQLHFDRFEGGHVWSGRIAFGVFDQVLKGA